MFIFLSNTYMFFKYSFEIFKDKKVKQNSEWPEILFESVSWASAREGHFVSPPHHTHPFVLVSNILLAGHETRLHTK